jgi:hypothetical protein
MELLFALPVLAALLLAAVGYARVSIVRSAVTQAAAVAAREAGKGASLEELVVAVDRVLAVHGMAISQSAGSGTKVVLDDGVAGRGEYGDPQLELPSPATPADEVRVSVCVRIPGSNAFTAAIYGRRLSSASAVKREALPAACMLTSVVRCN